MRKSEIKKGKRVMKSQQFNQQVRPNLGYTLRLLSDTIYLRILSLQAISRGVLGFIASNLQTKIALEATNQCCKSSSIITQGCTQRGAYFIGRHNK
jgi:hypothetical protein